MHPISAMMFRVPTVISIFLTSSIIMILADMDDNVNDSSDPSPFVCHEGYVMDTFCIDNDVFLDLPLAPLVHPGNHTAVCLLDPPQCFDSGYEILAEPIDDVSNYTRAIKLDQAGTAKMREYGYKIGSGCSQCTGDISQGIRATVIGELDNSEEAVNGVHDGVPPNLANTKAILDASVGCAKFDDARSKEELMCLEGFVMDTYCINRGGLLDTGGDPFTEPETHSIHCMVDVPICYENGFELLSDPNSVSNQDPNFHGRAVRFDAIGNELLLNHARGVGKKGGCSTCTNTSEDAPTVGLRATVVGYLADGAANVGIDESIPPVMNVLAIYDSSSVRCLNGRDNIEEEKDRDSDDESSSAHGHFAIHVVTIAAADSATLFVAMMSCTRM